MPLITKASADSILDLTPSEQPWLFLRHYLLRKPWRPDPESPGYTTDFARVHVFLIFALFAPCSIDFVCGVTGFPVSFVTRVKAYLDLKDEGPDGLVYLELTNVLTTGPVDCNIVQEILCFLMECREYGLLPLHFARNGVLLGGMQEEPEQYTYFDQEVL